LCPSSFVMCNTPVEVQFTSAGCLNYPCRTPRGAFSARPADRFPEPAQQPPHRRARRAAKTPAAKVNARGSDKGCGIGVNRRREIITGAFRSA
jgi:hypothetical protein